MIGGGRSPGPHPPAGAAAAGPAPGAETPLRGPRPAGPAEWRGVGADIFTEHRQVKRFGPASRVSPRPSKECGAAGRRVTFCRPCAWPVGNPPTLFGPCGASGRIRELDALTERRMVMPRWRLTLLTLLFTLGVLGAPGALAQTKTQPSAKTETKPAPTQAAPAPEKKALLDLNTASADELKPLLGIGTRSSRSRGQRKSSLGVSEIAGERQVHSWRSCCIRGLCRSPTARQCVRALPFVRDSGRIARASTPRWPRTGCPFSGQGDHALEFGAIGRPRAFGKVDELLGNRPVSLRRILLPCPVKPSENVTLDLIVAPFEMLPLSWRGLPRCPQRLGCQSGQRERPWPAARQR